MPLASFFSWAGRFQSYLVENAEDRFSHDEARIIGTCIKKSLTGSSSSFGRVSVRGMEVMGLIPGRDIPVVKKWYKLLLAWHTDLQGRARTGWPSVRIMWLECGIMSSVWGMILQWGSTIKVSFCNQILLWYDWKSVESNVKPEQTNNKSLEEPFSCTSWAGI